jgi:maltooligosyltrehalose trehalohydrolase
MTWSLEMGALVLADGVRFRVWAPDAGAVDVVVEWPRGLVAPLDVRRDRPRPPGGGGDTVAMERQDDGTWVAFVPGAVPGARYGYLLDGRGPFPDPYSRSQPEGVHGLSEAVDPSGFEWHDARWRGLETRGLVIYQCHVGTATPEGTLDSLISQLDRLVTLGVNAVQLLPLAEFPGARGWGYDGVDPLAVTRNYGGPAALQRFIDAAHLQQRGVILDVVYNHFGPDGCYLREFSPAYFTDRHRTPWGEALNFDGPGNERVRRLVLDSALMWVHDFHVDGLRLDATHAIADDSEPHILAELSNTVHASLPAGRRVVLIAESADNDVRDLLPTSKHGHGMDVVYADDFHHALRRYLLGEREGYYADYDGTLPEVTRVIDQGWLYEGQPSQYRGNQPRGTPAREQPAPQFLFAIQNHDQVGNRAFGDRLHHRLDTDRYRVASALLLFLPFTPLLFMGQEFAASSPFQYFTDHTPELGRLVREGRRKEFRRFSAFADPAVRDSIPDPQAEATFLRSKLPLSEAATEPGAGIQRLYAALLELRRTDPVLREQERRNMATEVPSGDVLVVRRRQHDAQRLFVANFGDAPACLPLAGPAWSVLLDTGDMALGGSGARTTVGADARVPARTGAVLGR